MYYFVFTILYAILAWRRLDLATVVLVMVLPVYQIRFSVGFLPMTLLEVMIWVLFIVWFVKAWQSGKLPLFNKKLRNVRHYPFYIEIILLLVVAFISVVVAGFSNASLGILKAYFMEPIMFFVVFINVFKIRENRDKIFWGLCISAFVISLVAIYQKITGNLMPLEYANSGRVTGVFGYPNALGLYLGPIVLLMFGFLLSKASDFNNKNSEFRIQNSELLYIGNVIALSVLVIYFAKSEGALVGVAASLFIFGLLYGKKARWVTVGLAVLIAGGIAMNSATRDYAINKVMLRNLDGQIRRQVWKESWQMLKDGRLITGAGLANFQKAVELYHQEGIFVKDYNDPDWHRKTVFNEEYRAKVWQPLEIYLYPHNVFLNFWSELGLFGMLLFVWIIGRFFYVGIMLRKILDIRYWILDISLLCAMVVVVVHGLVDVPYFKNDLAVVFWMMVAMMGILSPQIYKSATNNTNKR